MSTQQRVALVTGGARGIGRAIATRFLAEGWYVAINYRKDDAAASEMEKAFLGRCRAYRADISDSEAVTEMVEAVERDLGPVTALINNAGFWRGGLVHTLSSEDFMRVLSVTLIGAKNTLAAVIPHMKRRQYGHVVNVSSAVALIGWRGDSAYAAAKAGLIGLTKSVAKEVAGDGIRVNVILPGFVETDMTSAVSESQRAQLLRRTLLDRPGRPEDIASMVYAICVEGDFMTGSVLSVDGGLALGRDELSLGPADPITRTAENGEMRAHG